MSVTNFLINNVQDNILKISNFSQVSWFNAVEVSLHSSLISRLSRNTDFCQSKYSWSFSRVLFLWRCQRTWIIFTVNSLLFFKKKNNGLSRFCYCVYFAQGKLKYGKLWLFQGHTMAKYWEPNTVVLAPNCAVHAWAN